MESLHFISLSIVLKVICQVIEFLLTHGADVEHKSKHLLTPLHMAVKKGNPKLVEYILDWKMSIDIDDATMLIHSSALTGNNELLQLCIKRGLHNCYYSYQQRSIRCIDLRGERGSTPLHEATTNHHFETVKIILDNNLCDINATDDYGNTALHMAAINGDAEILGYLINQGAIVDAINKSGHTPLHRAIQRNRSIVIEMLILAGANRDAACKDGTVLHLACERNIQTRLISHKATPNIRVKNGKTPLHIAAERGHGLAVSNIVIEQSESGVDLNLTDIMGNTPLHLAVLNQHFYTVRELIRSGAKVDIKNKSGQSPLDLAKLLKSKEIVDILINPVPEQKTRHEEKLPKLLEAAGQGDVLEVEVNIASSSNIHISDSSGNNALHLATTDGHISIVGLLVYNGFNMNLTNNNGNTALHLACMNRRYDIVKLLLDNSANPYIKNKSGDTALHLAVLYSESDIMEAMIIRGVDVNTSNANGDSIIHYAVMGGNKKVIDRLLSYGADFKATNRLGETLLHWAVLNNNAEALEMLLNLNLDINAVDFNQDTPLHIASSNGNLQIVQSLLSHGANTTLQNADGRTALTLAFNSNHMQVRNAIAAAELGQTQNAHHPQLPKLELAEELEPDEPKIKQDAKGKQSPATPHTQDATQPINKPEISQSSPAHTEAVETLHPSEPGTVAAISDDQGGAISELEVISGETASKDHKPEKGSEEFQGKTTGF